ncbi:MULTISPECIES: CopG family transcriptional regulator [Natrialbaceae]|uniref:CopG family transcriptional regulator n=1 Tax=Natrialbaceae TaxID=1644061 RepID=UPI00207D08B2|nr:CopG family transcriptional regulator [Natronococcus sp. CG52]
MGRVNATVSDEHLAQVEQVKQSADSDMLAELRNEYESRITDLEQDVERLRNEKRTLINDREERTELVEYVEKEKSLSERKAQAGIVTRAKWFITRMPAEGE